MSKARIIIVEDELSVREGLSNWLSEEYDVSGFDSAEAFLNAINDFEFEDDLPTCLLLDFQMPGMNGVELQANLKLMNIQCPIIFMSGNAQQADIIDAWQGGAVNFILKPFAGPQISSAIEKLFEQSQRLQSTSLAIQPAKTFIDVPISQREAEVLLLLGAGERQNEVAEKLGITLRTVKMHRASLKNKLQLNTLGELTRYCHEHKLSIEKVLQN